MSPVRFPLAGVALLCVSAAALSSCSSTSAGARQDGTLVVDHRGWRDAVPQTWILEGAYPGALMKAETLQRVSVTTLGPLGYKTEILEPARKLQGTVDWTDSQQVMIAIRQRGVSRWTDLPINGRHSVGVAAEAGAESGPGYLDNLAWNRPSSWVGLGEAEESAPSPAFVSGTPLTDSPNPAAGAAAPGFGLAAEGAPEQRPTTQPVAQPIAQPTGNQDSGRWYLPWTWFGSESSAPAAPAPVLTAPAEAGTAAAPGTLPGTVPPRSADAAATPRPPIPVNAVSAQPAVEEESPWYWPW